MKTILNVRVLIAALLLMPLLAVPAMADYVFEANLTGDQPVPPTDSGAYGVAALIMDDAQTQITYTVNYTALYGEMTACGFYFGAEGAVGDMALELPLEVPLAGTWVITPEIADALLTEGLYLNISSDLYPDGEIRANLSAPLVDDESSSLDQIKALYR